MSVEEIEKAITKLSPKERAKLRAWWDALEADGWDRQIERDAKAGKLDSLADEALSEHREGLTRKL